MTTNLTWVRIGYVTAEVRAPADVDFAAVAAAVESMLPGDFSIDSAARAVGAPDVRIDVDRATALPRVEAPVGERMRVELGAAALAGPTLGIVLYTVTERARQHHGMVTVRAAAVLEPSGTTAVLLADTDTRNPDPATYRALLTPVTGPEPDAGIALADYRRHWDEGNLTNHLARSLIAAATGCDVPQPLASDIALAAAAVAAIGLARAALPDDVAAGVAATGSTRSCCRSRP